MVEIRNPHHLDPAKFLKNRHFAVLPLVVVGVLSGVRALPSARRRSVLLSFLSALMAFYGLGLISHLLGSTRLMMFYPFRVADVLLPLFFWLLVPSMIWTTFAKGADASVSAYRRRLAAVLCVGALFIFVSELHRLPRYAGRAISSWSEDGRASRDELRAVWHRIRSETAVDAIFVAPPCESRFWTDARRATVAGWKSAPSNARAFEWLDRMQLMNGGRAFEKHGHKICDELEKGFPNLSASNLSDLRDRYGATHYLVRRERPDLASHLLFEEAGGFVYLLEGVRARREH
jgi:hypothetical protein